MILKSSYLVWGTAILMGILFLLYFAVDKVIMPRVTRQGQTITVPDVVNQPFDHAVAAIERVGLVFSDSTARVAPDSSKLGLVVHQHPPAHASAKPGRRISLTVYDIVTPLHIQDLTQEHWRSAEKILKNKGLSTQVFPDPHPHPYRNRVTRTDPVAGSPVSRGDSVTIWYSLGLNKNRLIEIPDVVGEFYPAAEALLQNLYLWPELRDQENDTEMTEIGRILRQHPEPGELLPEGSVVRLYTKQK